MEFQLTVCSLTEPRRCGFEQRGHRAPLGIRGRGSVTLPAPRKLQPDLTGLVANDAGEELLGDPGFRAGVADKAKALGRPEAVERLASVVLTAASS